MSLSDRSQVTPEDGLTPPMAHFTRGKLLFDVHTLLGHFIQLSSAAWEPPLLFHSPSCIGVPKQDRISRFFPVSAEQGELLRCAGKLCLIQPPDLHPCQGALKDLLENTWSRRKPLSPELWLVGKCRISPSQGLEFASLALDEVPADLDCPECPKGQPCPPASVCHVEQCGNLLGDMLSPCPQLDISPQFILPLTPKMFQLQIIMDVSKWMHVQNETIKFCLES